MAALAVSGIPFAGPIGAARVGYADGRYLLNPGFEALQTSALNMVVAGTDSAVLMVESEAKELSEDQMLGGVLYGHMEMQVAINAIKELAAEAGKPRWEFTPPAVDAALADREYLAGAFSGADIMTGHACIVASRLGADIADKPGVQAYIDRLSARPALQRAWEA